MSEKWRPAAAVNDCGGRATERQKEEMERRERETDREELCEVYLHSLRRWY